MKVKIFLIAFLLVCSNIVAQDINNVQLPNMVKTRARKEIKIPGIMGYQTLKCDFHIHTVFSDGVVWPVFRVDEAWEEGLDAIAITDHIENQPSKKFIGGDHNSSYEIAKENAKNKNIILIPSGEVTRKMPPGHLNVLFVNDINILDKSDPVEALTEAKKQGAFIFWNHPGWKAQQPDTCLWWPMHQELFEKGLINGIEVFNEMEYYPIVLDWCLSKKLAVIANSDIHDVTSMVYDLEKGHRPITLVFAKERTGESIKQALFDKRTLAFFDGKLAGQEELLKAMFNASIRIKPIGSADNNKEGLYEIFNSSAIQFDLETEEGERVTFPAESAIILNLKKGGFKKIKVKNLFTGSKSNLKVDLF